LAAAGDIAGAIEQLARWAQRDDVGPVWDALAELAERYGASEHRVQALERAVHHNPDATRTRAFAEALECTGEWARATDAWSRAQETLDDALALGRCALRAGRLQQSAAALTSVLSDQPGHPEATRLLGHAAAERGDWSTARSLLGSLQDPESLADLSRVLRLAGDAGAAVAAAKKSVELEPSPRAYGRWAEAALDAERWGEANDAAQKALGLQPDDPRVQMLVMRCLLRAGEPDRALAVGDPQTGHAGVLALRTVGLAAAGRGDEAETLRGVERFLRTRTIACDVDAVAEALDGMAWNEAPASHATVGGGHSADLYRGASEALDHVLDAISDAVVSHVRDLPPRRHAWLAARPKVTGLHAWSVRVCGPGHQTPHVHPDGWLSGVLYLRVPSLESPAGSLAFAGPDRGLEGLATFARRTVAPQAGTLVLFPSHLWHETLPTHVERERMSLAFDVLPRG
jgi:uncharacterized protein (TIGR02466 family)